MIYPSTDELLRLLASSVLVGGCICLAYDSLRIIRIFTEASGDTPPRLSLPYPQHFRFRFFLAPKWSILLTNLGDILFFLFCGAALAVYFSAANHGRIRWLALAGMGGGFLTCRLTLSVLILRCAETAAELLRFLLVWTLWLVCCPFCLLWRVLRRAAGFVGSALFYLALPLYTQWKMKRCIVQLSRFYHQKRRTHNGTA